MMVVQEGLVKRSPNWSEDYSDHHQVCQTFQILLQDAIDTEEKQRKQNNKQKMPTKTIGVGLYIWHLAMTEKKSTVAKIGRNSTQWQQGKKNLTLMFSLSRHGSALHFTDRYSLFCTFPHSELTACPKTTAQPKHTQSCGPV